MFLNLLNELGKIDNAEKKEKDKDKTCRHALHVCDVVRQQSINVFDVNNAALRCFHCAKKPVLCVLRSELQHVLLALRLHYEH